VLAIYLCVGVRFPLLADNCLSEYVPSPDAGPYLNSFAGIGGTAPTDVWAVGSFEGPRSTISRTLAEHWDGTNWSVVPSPDLDLHDYNNELIGVASVSTSDVWAVGGLFPRGPHNLSQSLALHWNGHDWASVQTPPNAGVLYGLSVIGQTHTLWAVGFSNAQQPFVEFWNGQAWSIVTSPTFPGGGNLSAVSSPSAVSAWAVGSFLDSSGNYQTLAEHWQGHKWVEVPTQNPGTYAIFDGVAALSDTNVWAVGSYYDPSSNTSRNLVEHWDGSIWRVANVPSAAGLNSALSSVSALSHTNVWMVGSTYDPNGPIINFKSLVLHWDGIHWVTVPNPRPTDDDDTVAVAAFLRTVWSVGRTYDPATGYNHTFTLLSHC
jgi:hypothetical protein